MAALITPAASLDDQGYNARPGGYRHLGAAVAFALAGGLAEGAIMGALLGGSVGTLAAARMLSGGAGPAYEAEAAGLHDDNLTTIMRRNLMRETRREFFASDDINH